MALMMACFVNITSFDIWSSLDILAHVLKLSLHTSYILYISVVLRKEKARKKTSLFNFMSNCQAESCEKFMMYYLLNVQCNSSVRNKIYLALMVFKDK